MQSSASVVFRAMVMLLCLVAIPLAAVFGGSLPEMFKTLLERRWFARSASAHPSFDEVSRFQPMESSDASAEDSGQRISPDEPSATVGASGPGGFQRNVQSDAASEGGPAKMVSKDRRVPVSVAGGQHPATAGQGDPAAARASAPVDQFMCIQDRLRKLGATHYLLESWGNHEQLYRFCCKMALDGSPNYTRYFEATDSDPLRTMTQVLQQVEAWQAGRR